MYGAVGPKNGVKKGEPTGSPAKLAPLNKSFITTVSGGNTKHLVVTAATLPTPAQTPPRLFFEVQP